MTVGATEGPIGVPGTVPSASNGLSTTIPAGGSSDKDMFLQLLVAQMKYQDPMNPTDSSQFLAQSAQFTSLEKMQSVSDRTGLLLGAQMAFGASSLVGRSVTYTLDDGTPGSGTVHGVEFGADGPVLDVDGVKVPIAHVLNVNDGSGTPPTAT
jgi:flagellar basal-body rod modification protein FlgD